MSEVGVTFTCKIEGGKLPDRVRTAIAALLGRMDGKVVEVRVTRKVKRRSGHQNAFYFGVVVPMVRQMFLDAGTALSPDETHAFIKQHVWKHVKYVTLPDGEVKEVPDSSTKLSTMGWEEKIELTRQWAAEYGVEIPFPNQAAMPYLAA